MKKAKTLIICGAVLAALCIGIVITLNVEKKIEEINTVDETVISIEESSLEKISWKTEDGELTFESTDDVWSLSSDVTFPVDQEEMSDLFLHFIDVHASFKIENVEDYSQYGFDDPVCTVTYTITDEDEKVLKMGDFSTMDSKRYITFEDGNVYLIDDDLYEYISVNQDDYLDNDEIPASTNLTKFTVSGENDLTIAYDLEGEYSYTDVYCYYLLDGETYKELSTSLAKNFIANISTLTLSSYATYNADTADLSVYGLDNPALSVNYVGEYDTDGEVSDVDYTFYIGTPDGGETVYGRLNDSKIIYTLSAELYETIRDASYDTLRPSEILSLDYSAVKNVSFTYDDATYSVDIVVTQEAEETEAADTAEATDAAEAEDDYDVYDSEETEAAETEAESEATTSSIVTKCMMGETEVEFGDVKTAISALTINEFSKNAAEKKLELSLTVTQDNESFPSITVEFYQYDGDNCLAVKDGETVGLIERSLVADLKEAVTSMVLAAEG